MAILQQPLVQQVNTGRRSGSSRWPASALAGRAALGAAAFALVIIGLGVQFARLHGQWPQNYEAPSVQDAASSSAPLLGQQRVQPVKLLYPVWWHAPFYTGTGYSTEAISYISSLLQAERFRPEDLWISHSGDHMHEHVENSLDEATRQLLQEQEYNSLIRGRLAKSELERPAIAVCHSFPDCWSMPQDIPTMTVPGCPCPPPEMNDQIVYRIGRTMFETAGLPQHLVQHCNAMDEIWVPTEFNKQTFILAGVDPGKLRVVPQGIDASSFDPSRHAPLNLKALPGAQLLTGSTVSNATLEPYVFMSVFKWETRKGWDILLEAYASEFQGLSEPVELHIFTKPFANKDQDIGREIHAWLQARLGLQPGQAATLPKIYLHTSYLDDSTYKRLYASCDAVVLPTRGEGWGRPQMEAMSMAKPIITTNWSGPTAYINADVAYPLRYDKITPAATDMQLTNLDKKSFNNYFEGELWAQPSVEHLKQLMRRVFTHPAEAAAKGKAARQHILQHFTPVVLASVVMSEIVRIQDKLGPGRTAPTAEQRAERQQSHALCSAYPHLCSQGPTGLAEAAKRAQASFSHYRGRDATARAMISGHLTVQELLARGRESHAAASGITHTP